MGSILKNSRGIGRPSLIVALAAIGPGVGVLLVLGPAVAYADWLQRGDFVVAVCLLLIGIIGCGLALLPTHAVSLVMGFAFGIWLGPVLAIISVTFAACLGYIIAKPLVGPGLVAFAKNHPRLNILLEQLTTNTPDTTRSAITIITLIRLSPVMPFAATNTLLAALRIRTRHFLIGTIVGMAPRVIAVAVLGAGLSQLDFNQPHTAWLLTLGIVATVALLALLARMARKVKL